MGAAGAALHRDGGAHGPGHDRHLAGARAGIQGGRARRSGIGYLLVVVVVDDDDVIDHAVLNLHVGSNSCTIWQL